MPTCLKCNNVFKNLEKINGQIKNLSKRKYCLICSPFNAKNRKKLHLDNSKNETSSNGTTKFCAVCKILKPIDKFYTSKGKTHLYCASCHNKISGHRLKIFKLQCLEYKGSKCEKCGYQKYPGALEFHHKTEFDKEFEIARVKHCEFNKKITDELDKCSLLCSNCHREHHEVPSEPHILEFIASAKTRSRKRKTEKAANKHCSSCNKEIFKSRKLCADCVVYNNRNKSTTKLPFFCKEELIKILQQKSIADLAKEYNVGKRTVYKRLYKLGIKLTSHSYSS